MQDNNLLDQIVLTIDERYSVAVSKDHNHGVVIQVARMNPVHVKNDSGVSYKGHTPVVMYQKTISYGSIDKTGKAHSTKDEAQLKSEINTEVVRAKAIAMKLKQTEAYIDDILKKIKEELT